MSHHQKEGSNLEFFHAPVKIISCQKGHSAVAAAAYRRGTCLECTYSVIRTFTTKYVKTEPNTSGVPVAYAPELCCID